MLEYIVSPVNIGVNVLVNAQMLLLQFQNDLYNKKKYCVRVHFTGFFKKFFLAYFIHKQCLKSFITCQEVDKQIKIYRDFLREI